MSGELDKSYKENEKGFCRQILSKINSSQKMAFENSDDSVFKKSPGGIVNEMVEEVLDPPEELNDVGLPSIDFDQIGRTGVHIAPAFSLLNRDNKNRASQYIRRNFKMKDSRRSEDIPKVVEVPTTCFGTVEFRGASRRTKSKFIRLSNDTPPEVIYNLLVEYWKMEPPQLLISVTGGAKNFSMSPMLKQNFVAGISKVASTPGAWVITGGTNCGVMKYVGEAMQGLSKPCIGIATWGVISKREELDPGTCNPYETATKCKVLSDNSFSYEVGSWLTEKGAYLDSNHTHFLLVDDGTENKFGVEIPVRGSLERYIMAEAIKHEDKIRKVPSVLVVLEGGEGTLGTILSAVSGENPVPVVVVKSSGRAADLVAYALTISKEIKMAHLTHLDGFHEGLTDAIGVYLPELNMEKRKAVYNQVLACLKYDSMFTVSQVGTEVDLDDAILTALLNDNFTCRYRQLQLTLVWNRADLARARIMSSMLDWDKSDNPMELQWLMIMALAMNNVSFVELLMEYGVCLGLFLTTELMEFLYGFRSYNKSSPLRYEIRDNEYQGIPKYSENASIYKYLCSQDELVSPDNVVVPRHLIEEIIRQICKPLIRKGNETFIEPNRESEPSFRYPFKELYIWAVLNNMQEMAVFFWARGEEHIAKALIGAHICHALSNRRSITQGDIKTSLNESEGIFKDGALQLLDHCYRKDEYKTRTLITCDLDQFNELNVMKLASRASNIDFVSHYAVQGLLEDVWVGNLRMKQLSLTKVLFSSILIFPILRRSCFQFCTEEEMLTLSNYEDDVLEVKDDDEADTTIREATKDSSSRRRRMTVQQRRARVERGHGTELSHCRKLVEFYLYSPIVKFVNHVVGYVLFLILFAYVSMLKKGGQTPCGLEWLLVVTVIAFLVAELYQFSQMNAPSYYAMFTQWAYSGINLFDAFVIIFYFVALGCRLSSSPEVYKAGHVMYAIDCGLWIFRLLTVCFISPTLGPYLVMIKRMSKDLMIFLSVLIVVIIGYGVTTTAILGPFKSAHVNMIRNPFWQPYFNIYGELFVDRDPSSPTETRFGTKKTETYDEAIVWILLGIYLLFTNILLLNLLIAVFNNTYTIVQEKSTQIWAFKRYHLIMEYANRHALFPPLSLIGHTFHLIRWFLWKCQGIKTHRSMGLKTILNPEQKEYLLQFECKCMTNLSRSKYNGVTKDVSAMTTEILEELDGIKSEMIRIKEKVFTKNESNDDEDEPITSPVGKTFSMYIKRKGC